MRVLVFITATFLLFSINSANASTKEGGSNELNLRRMELYQKTETLTQIPWYYLAAVDQYERNIRLTRKNLPDPEGKISIYFQDEQWSGRLNPIMNDKNPLRIQFFGGYGFDGDGDGKASNKQDEDVLHSFATYILKFGSDEENIRIALWEYYHRDKAVGIIMGLAKIYKYFGRIDLEGSAFPLPLRSNHSYKNTWGDARGWGGRRIHEGTDIFAGYGVPVRATGYGIVEMKGWNRYGGWRIGIRDVYNTYHYFAHLSGFSKELKVGSIVEPGMLIGGVGSSGYGPPGTSGRFPPHLHYGMYKDNGLTEWSFDPYPHLRKWERQERITRQKGRISK